ncbi:hypothetical protein ABTC12_19745, partial [Acinetobacter baumannii]
NMQLGGSNELAFFGFDGSAWANRFNVSLAGNGSFQGTITAGGIIQSALSTGTVRTSASDAAGMLHIRPNQYQNGYITFTENAVADRWA